MNFYSSQFAFDLLLQNQDKLWANGGMGPEYRYIQIDQYSVSACLNVSQRVNVLLVTFLLVFVSGVSGNTMCGGNRTMCEIVEPSLMCLLMKGLRAAVPPWKEEIVPSDKVWKKSQCKNRESEGQPECLISLRAEQDTHREDSCPRHKIYDITDYQKKKERRKRNKNLQHLSRHTRNLILLLWNCVHGGGVQLKSRDINKSKMALFCCLFKINKGKKCYHTLHVLWTRWETLSDIILMLYNKCASCSRT